MMGTCWLFCLSPLLVTLIFPQNLCLPFVLPTAFSGLAGWLELPFSNELRRRRSECTKKKSGYEFPAPFLRYVHLTHLCTAIAIVESPPDNTVSSGLCASGDTIFHPCSFWLQDENNFLLSLVCRYFSFFLSSLGSSIYA